MTSLVKGGWDELVPLFWTSQKEDNEPLELFDGDATASHQRVQTRSCPLLEIIRPTCRCNDKGIGPTPVAQPVPTVVINPQSRAVIGKRLAA